MAAVDYFLKIDGIPGESTDDKHQGEIDIMSFSWGATNPATASAGGGGGAGRVQLQPLHLAKPTDTSSPNLFLKCATGQVLKSAVLTAQTTVGEQPVEFLKITLSDVLVSSYQISASTNPGPPNIVAAPVDTVFVAPNQGIVGPDLPADAVALSYRSAQFSEGPQQHIAVTPTGTGTLAFDPKTGLVTFYPPDPGAPAPMTVGSVNGGIQRAVQEFNIANLIGLLTAPFSTAHLRLAVNEIRESPINPGVANIASVNAKSETEAPRPHLFDVILYAPADGVITASDLTAPAFRPGRQKPGTLLVDPNAPPATLTMDLTDVVVQNNLSAFGIRIQLHGLNLPDPFNEPEDVHSDSDTEDDKPRAPFSASFSLELALDTA